MSGDDGKKEYPRPALTADVVAVLLDEGGLRVLFIRRGNEPWKGTWALPGGFCEPTETVAQAAARELLEETGVRDVHLEELGCFSRPGRDPRGWVVTVAHLGVLPAHRASEATGSDDAAEAAWLRLVIHHDGTHSLEHAGVPVTTLAFDHTEVMDLAVRRLRERVADLALALLPEPFTLGMAQRAFEAILGAAIDPAAFRARLFEKTLVSEAPGADKAAPPRYVAVPRRPEREWPFTPRASHGPTTIRIFGLTGGLASGKSTVAARFRARGVPVIDADQIAREVVEPGSEGLARVVEAFGSEVLLHDGSLDRARLGEIVFAAPEKRRALNAIVHPRIAARSAQRIAELEAAGEALACYEAALLVENGLGDAFRPLVVVAVPPEVQVTRAMARDGSTEAQARSRIAAQLSLATKIAAADYVIDNAGDRAETERRADEVLDAIRAKAG